MKLKGLGVSSGVGIGKLVVIKEDSFDVEKRSVDAKKEEIRFKKAVSKLISALETRAKNVGTEQAEIMESHIILLNDPFVMTEIVKRIQDESCNSEYALDQILSQFIDMFLSSGDDLLEARASDLKDIKNNILLILNEKELTDVAALPRGTILAAEELTTSIAAAINPKNICAILTKEGGTNSHMAIIARSIGVPAIVGVDVAKLESGKYMIADGDTGVLIADPTAEERTTYLKKQEDIKARKIALEKYRGKESITADGRSIELCANIGLELDIHHAVEADAEGVGLFRTEFLYMNRTSAPKEEEQFAIYKKAALAFVGRPVIIRTLDIGGDKEIPYLGLEKEENPFLGWRAIRYCLDKQEIFKTQIRAILRASAFGEIKIMIPMISSIDEFRRTKALIHEVMQALSKEEIAYHKEIQIGIMVETPAAAVMADIFAKEVDFFSIGTNDLTQYTMAVDRGNKKVACLYSAYSPAVLRLIYQVAQAAKENGIMCGVCGEAGSDPLLIKFFIGCGINELSMTGTAILQAREIILGTTYGTVREQVAQNLLNLIGVEDTIKFLNTL